jgi:Zn-dependent M16 (insulinase) family peptidase
MKGEVATEHYFSNITQDDIQKTRDEVLHTGKSDIKRFAEMIRGVMAEDYYCVIGSDVKIKENKEIFQNLVSVFEG